MLKSQVFAILFVFIYAVNTFVVNKDLIHNFMDNQELQYYFGTESKFHVPEYELVDVVARGAKVNDISGDQVNDFHLKLKAFDDDIFLKLKLNKNLVSPFMRYVEKSQESGEKELQGKSQECHYLHVDVRSSAALSGCDGRNINGIILLPNKTLEVKSLTSRLKSIWNHTGNAQAPHIVKIVDSPDFNNDLESNNFFWTFPGQPESVRQLAKKFIINGSASSEGHNLTRLVASRKTKRGTKELKTTIEIAVFFDAAAYQTFAPYLDYNYDKVRDMLLAYINGVQSLYHHPSLGTPIDLTIVYMEIMKSQPLDMPHYNGERSLLLDSFCVYQKSINPVNDTNPNHWDMGLYISGLDFFAYENGRRDTVTMGLATVGGVCIEEYACVIAEFGTTNIFGKPYPSAGFTSVYIMAHEIGHNLGMHHDASGNSCPKEGFVMSPSRGTMGETTWSTCSADVVRDLSYATCLHDKPPSVPIDYNSWKYEGYPGLVFTAKKQCELLLTDKDAMVSQTNGLSRICENLHCRTPHRSGYYFAGPALDGTNCGNGQWCEAGYCVKNRPLVKPIEYVKGGWSPWVKKECKSECLDKGKGYQIRQRHCNNPKPVNTDEGCPGPAYSVAICSDVEICNIAAKRTTIDFAIERCREFSKSLPDLDPDGLGLQAPHEFSRLWMGCAIFCKRRNTGAYYTPKFELNDLGIDPYFPDGTWCHADDSQNYYCLQHHCLPENFEITKHNAWLLSDDIPMAGNAGPNLLPLNEKIIQYLSIGENGLPLRTRLDPNDFEGDDSRLWENKDYVDLPQMDVN